jgi:rhodanese-related sulfurtransferase
MIVDVRSPSEFAAGKLKNAVNIPLDELAHRLTELPKDKKVILHCELGTRAEMAFNLLKNQNVDSRYLNASIAIAKDGSFTLKE